MEWRVEEGDECIVCRREYSPRSRQNETWEPICGDCKSSVGDDNESSPPARNGESTYDLFSQQYSQLISLARRNQETSQLEEAIMTPSHTETDRDSWFGESDSNFSLYGGDSEMDLDFSAHEDHDTDIDPMQAVLNHFDEDYDTEWEEASSVRLRHLHSPEDSNLFEDLDSRDFEELLQQFDDLRRGAPPASASAVEKLPTLVISTNHSSLACAVCKDPLCVDSEAKQLPCMHLYHPMCILPWLSARNSCPVCRFELPTDDFEYEQLKRARLHDTSSHLSSEAGDAPNVGGSRWYLVVAAPVVSILGIALALWFRTSTTHHHTHSRGLRARR